MFRKPWCIHAQRGKNPKLTALLVKAWSGRVSKHGYQGGKKQEKEERKEKRRKVGKKIDGGGGKLAKLSNDPRYDDYLVVGNNGRRRAGRPTKRSSIRIR